jgi:succinoglycan biosynthesis protein ExoU
MAVLRRYLSEPGWSKPIDHVYLDLGDSSSGPLVSNDRIEWDPGAKNMKDRSRCVDVLIAVFNDANTIEKAVVSALSNVEVNRVIVVDDGSMDETPAVVRSLRCKVGERLVFLELDRNEGPSAARNRGLGLSDAPWVAILDGDDYFLPDRFAALLDASEGADFIADDQLQVREEKSDDGVAGGEFLVGHDEIIAVDLATFIAENLSKGRRQRKEFGFLKPIMRRSFLDLHQLRYDERLRLGEDFILYATALAMGAVFKVVPFRTYVSVVRSGSISGNHSKGDLERLRERSKDLAGLPQLTVSERKLFRQHSDSIDARVQWLNVIDAVKRRSVTAFLSPFFIRWSTLVFLLGQLWEQIVLRSKKALGFI